LIVCWQGYFFTVRGCDFLWDSLYKEFIPFFTTALNSKPETIIRKYKERFLIERTNKELKSYLNIEGNYFKTKESNYGYYFLLCLVYNFVRCTESQLPDMSFKDVLGYISSYLLYVDPPQCVFTIEGPFESLFRDIGYEVPNKMNTKLTVDILLSDVVYS
jgi:hypothetical protein